VTVEDVFQPKAVNLVMASVIGNSMNSQITEFVPKFKISSSFCYTWSYGIFFFTWFSVAEQ